MFLSLHYRLCLTLAEMSAHLQKNMLFHWEKLMILLVLEFILNLTEKVHFALFS